MGLNTAATDALDARSTTSGLSADPPPSTTLPPGPRRIHDRRGWRRMRRVLLAGLTGLAGGGVAAWALTGPALPAWLRLPQPAGTIPATDLFMPLLLAAIGLAALWRLSAWVLPLVMAGLLLGCGVPLLLEPRADPLDLLASAPLLSALALPLLAAVLNRGLMRRLGLPGRLASRREIAGFALLAGVAAPVLAGLLAVGVLLALGLTRSGAVAGALELAGAWSLALLSAGTALQASTQRPRRNGRWAARLIAVAALATQAALAWRPAAGDLLLAPHLLLCLHALQATPR
ncbi:hypothetical protein, partial [Roseateles sp.]|uniref:hypothetical protein n=1 Tax=Roseateles sp. TaxID=1971397 RepID=UPI002E00A53C|nr:hypothetical protein [Roseateles sp.]